MKFISILLLFFLSIGIFGKSNFIALIKKIKSPAELAASSESDTESRGIDDDTTKEKDSKESSEEKITYCHSLDSSIISFVLSSSDKQHISFYNAVFNSHFKEVATPPPPELV